MILEAFKYMILGMVVVFAFLYLLTIILEFQRKIINKYFPEKEYQKTNSSKKDKLKKVAAIAAAIHHQRKKNGN